MKITIPTEISTVLNDDIEVLSSKLELKGITTGNIHLSGDSILEHHGIHNGNLYVEKNCSANIRGIFNGSINNHGNTQICGIVNSDSLSGHNIFIHKDSIINGNRYLSDEIL